MSSFFYRILDWFRWLFGVVPRSTLGSPIVYLVLHYLGLILVTGLLAYFSNRIIAPEKIDIDNAFVQRCWCGILFLLVYLVIRVVLYLIGLLKLEENPEFIDIDRCWAAGMEALEREQIDFRWLPVFLVNGLTVEQERNFFQAARMSWRITAPPLDDSSAVLRFFASDEAIFVSCTGVGAMNRQLTRPIAEADPQADHLPPDDAGPAGTLVAGQIHGGGGGMPGAAAGGGTMQPGVLAGMTQPAPRRSSGGTLMGTLQSVGAAVAQFTMMPGGMHRSLQSALQKASDQAEPALTPLTPEELEFGCRRIQYLCDLLHRSRTPFCPINGMLQAAPLDWSESQTKINTLSPAVEADTDTVHHHLELQFPIAFMLTGLEKVPGFGEFIKRCSAVDSRFATSRAGSRFPAGLPVNDEAAGWAVERELHWFRSWVYSAYAKDLDHRGNRGLYHMLCELSKRRRELAGQLKLTFGGLAGPDEPNPRLGGCYLAAVGDGSSNQSFVKGVLHKLIGEQGDVAWTPQKIRGDKRARTLAWVLFVSAAVLAVVDCVIVAADLTKGGS